MSNRDYDMKPILKVINDAHSKLMELTVPKKPKMKKREKALRELDEFCIEEYRGNINTIKEAGKIRGEIIAHNGAVSIIRTKIEQMLNEDE